MFHASWTAASHRTGNNRHCGISKLSASVSRIQSNQPIQAQGGQDQPELIKAWLLTPLRTRIATMLKDLHACRQMAQITQIKTLVVPHSPSSHHGDQHHLLVEVAVEGIQLETQTEHALITGASRVRNQISSPWITFRQHQNTGRFKYPFSEK